MKTLSATRPLTSHIIQNHLKTYLKVGVEIGVDETVSIFLKTKTAGLQRVDYTGDNRVTQVDALATFCQTLLPKHDNFRFNDMRKRSLPETVSQVEVQPVAEQPVPEETSTPAETEPEPVYCVAMTKTGRSGSKRCGNRVKHPGDLCHVHAPKEVEEPRAVVGCPDDLMQTLKEIVAVQTLQLAK